MSILNHGQVEIELGGSVYTLKPTLNACEKIEARWKSIIGACQQVQQMPISDLAYIVAAGAGIGQREAKDLKKDIFLEGQLSVMTRVAEYLTLLLDPTGKGDSEAEDNDAGE